MARDIIFEIITTNGERRQICTETFQQEPTETSKQPIRTRYLDPVTGYQPISDQYFPIWSVPAFQFQNRVALLDFCQVAASPDIAKCNDWSGRYNAPRVCAEFDSDYQPFDNKCALGILLCQTNNLDNNICSQYEIEKFVEMLTDDVLREFIAEDSNCWKCPTDCAGPGGGPVCDKSNIQYPNRFEIMEPTETNKQPIKTRYLGHMTLPFPRTSPVGRAGLLVSSILKISEGIIMFKRGMQTVRVEQGNNKLFKDRLWNRPKQPIRTRYLGHMTVYQPIRDHVEDLTEHWHDPILENCGQSIGLIRNVSKHDVHALLDTIKSWVLSGVVFLSLSISLALYLSLSHSLSLSLSLSLPLSLSHLSIMDLARDDTKINSHNEQRCSYKTEACTIEKRTESAFVEEAWCFHANPSLSGGAIPHLILSWGRRRQTDQTHCSFIP
eukprot:sb/3464781/